MQKKTFFTSVAVLTLGLVALIAVNFHLRYTNSKVIAQPKTHPPLALAHIHTGLQGKPYSAERVKDLLCVQNANYAMTLFIEAHHGYLPDASHWENAIKPYWPKINFGKTTPFSVVLYAPPGEEPHRLAMNKKLSGISFNNIANVEETILFYETVSTQQNVSGNPATLPSLDKNDGYDWVICYTDGRCNLN